MQRSGTGVFTTETRRTQRFTETSVHLRVLRVCAVKIPERLREMNEA